MEVSHLVIMIKVCPYVRTIDAILQILFLKNCIKYCHFAVMLVTFTGLSVGVLDTV